MSLQSKALKAVAICVLVAFSTIALRVDLLAAPKVKPQPAVQKKVTSAARFQTLLKDTEKLLEGMGAGLEQKKDVSAKLKELKRHRSDLQDLAGTIRAEFTKTREELIAKKLPPEIIQRHDAFVQRFEDNFKTLLMDLDEIEKPREGGLRGILKGLAGVEKAEVNKKRVEAAREHLKKNIYRKKHIPLDPNKLPHRQSDLKPRKPITDPKEFKKLFPQNQQSSVSRDSVLSTILGIGTAYAQEDPIDPNLAETIEVQFTQEIQDLAASLDHDPVKIYEWVRNNVEFVPTYGSIQGAHMTLLTKQGNAFDISSLLIALLRVSNIKARYVYGTIEVPIEKVMNWVGGFTDEKSAVDFIASGGVPITAGFSGGEITAVRMEHVWVEAFVDYIPSRGAVHKEGDTWIALDPSFKQYQRVKGVDFSQEVPFDAQAVFDELKETATVGDHYVTGMDQLILQQRIQEYQQQLQNYVQENFPDATFEEIVGEDTIIKKEYGFLPSALPGSIVQILDRFSSIPASMMHKLILEIPSTDWLMSEQPDLRFEIFLPEVAGKKITLSFKPASDSDYEMLKSLLPRIPEGNTLTIEDLPSEIPAYLVHVRPEIMIEGEVVTTGNKAITMGQTLSFIMEFVVRGTNTGADKIENVVKAGATYAIGLDLSKITTEILNKRKQKVEEVAALLQAREIGEISKDDLVGEMLYSSILTYFYQRDLHNWLIAKTTGVVPLRLPSAGMTCSDVEVSYFWGVPNTITPSGTFIDVDRDIVTPFSTNGKSESSLQFMISSGQMASGLEHGVWEEEFVGCQAISAVKALQIANASGIPVYGVNSDNAAIVIPELRAGGIPEYVITDIQNGINQGKIATVSGTPVTFAGQQFIGYIVLDPETGAAAYLIGGIGTSALAGGINILDWIIERLTFIAQYWWEGFKEMAEWIWDMLCDVGEWIYEYIWLPIKAFMEKVIKWWNNLSTLEKIGVIGTILIFVAIAILLVIKFAIVGLVLLILSVVFFIMTIIEDILETEEGEENSFLRFLSSKNWYAFVIQRLKNLTTLPFRTEKGLKIITV